MKQKIFLILFISMISLGGFAQNSITGSVVDAVTGQTLSGANIVLGGKLSTTGADGSFTIECGKAGPANISFVGYETLRQPVKCGGNYTFSLTPLNKDLEEVEITATSNRNKSLLYQPAAITKLQALELKRGTGLFFDDAINGNVPGVTMNRRGVSSGQQINIRGYGNGSRGTRGASSNFDGQGYKLYLNGIPVTDAEGITVLDDIDFGSIGSVEVAKGPAGTLYGLAIAGAVNLKTIRPKKGQTSLSQEAMFGNYGLRRYTTTFQAGGERSSILLNYGHQRSDGFTIHNASKKQFVNAVGEFQPNARQTINAYMGYSNSYDERSGELTIAQYNNNDYSGNIEYIKRNAHSNVYSVRAGLGHTYAFCNNMSNSTTIFGTAFNSNASSAGGWTDKSSTNLGIRSTFDTKFNIGNNITLSGITGVESQRQNAQTIGYSMVKNPKDTAAVWKFGNPYYWIIGASNSNIYTTTSTTSVFTEWTLALPKDLSLTAGIGYSNMNITLEDRFYVANKPTYYDTSYTKMFSPHVAINKVFNKQVSVYASYSTGYKAPVSSYFFIPFNAVFGPQSGIINSKLKPEQGNQVEVGTKGSLLHSKLNYSLAFFDAIFKDKMTTVAVPFNSSTTMYSYVTNGGKQDDKGIEAAVRYSLYESAKGFFKTITPFANMTYSDFEYKNFRFQTIGKTVSTPLKDSAYTSDYSGKAVAGVSKFVYNVGVDINTNPGLYANVIFMHREKMPITSDGKEFTRGFDLLNAKIGFQRSLSKHFDMNAYFGATNITNTKHPIMVFVNQLPDAYIAAPRNANVYGGINLKYNF